MIQLLPIVRYTGDISLIETDEAIDKCLPEIFKEKVLGFDTETRPNFQKGKQYPVSILQLAGEKKVWVIRLDPLSHRLADIFEIFENPSIKKVGLAVQGDIKALKSRWLFNPMGFVDISDLTSKIGVINTGMKNLTALIFGERISKSSQLTNWASETLTEKQIEYAATDAWMGRRLYMEIKRAMRDTTIVIEPEPLPKSERFSIKKFVKSLVKTFSIPKKKKTASSSEKKQARQPLGNFSTRKQDRLQGVQKSHGRVHVRGKRNEENRKFE